MSRETMILDSDSGSPTPINSEIEANYSGDLEASVAVSIAGSSAGNKYLQRKRKTAPPLSSDKDELA